MPNIDRHTTVLAITRAGADLAARGWLLATGGNLSTRLEGTNLRVLMTASGSDKGRLGDDDFVEMAHDGTWTPDDRKPSAETSVHMMLYAKLGVGAVVHVHSPYATLISRRYQRDGGVRFEGFEYVKALGFWEQDAAVDLAVVPNHHDLDALASAVSSAAGDAPAVLVAGHGIYAWGASLSDALRHVEATEFLCRMLWDEGRDA